MTQQARILVVDDIPDNRELLCRLLSRQGHATAAASNGAEALAMIVKSQFDCILLDIMMPVMGGIETLSRLKDDETLRHVPVIVVSAIDDIDNVVKCIELGAEDYSVQARQQGDSQRARLGLARKETAARPGAGVYAPCQARAGAGPPDPGGFPARGSFRSPRAGK